MRNLLHTIMHLPRKAIAALITGYQRTLSPDHGALKHLFPYGYCRHSPTCSEFSKEQILKRGMIVGGAKAIARVLSCNPFRKPSEKRILEVAAKM